MAKVKVEFEINAGLASQITSMMQEPDITKACKKAISAHHSYLHDSAKDSPSDYRQSVMNEE